MAFFKLYGCLVNTEAAIPFFETKDPIEICEMMVECGIINVLAPVLKVRLPRELVMQNQTWPAVKYYILSILAFLAGLFLRHTLCFLIESLLSHITYRLDFFFSH